MPPKGPGAVVYVSLLKERIKVKLDNEQGADIVEYPIDEEQIVKDAEKKSDHEDKLLEELEEIKELED